MSKRKYKKGRQITSVSDFDSCESLWYIWNEKTIHRSFLISLQYRTLVNLIMRGCIYIADLIKKEEQDADGA